jgi:hypothetical protein
MPSLFALFCPENLLGSSSSAIGFTFAPPVFGITPAVVPSSAADSTTATQNTELPDVSCPSLPSFCLFAILCPLRAPIELKPTTLRFDDPSIRPSPLRESTLNNIQFHRTFLMTAVVIMPSFQAIDHQQSCCNERCSMLLILMTCWHFPIDHRAQPAAAAMPRSCVHRLINELSLKKTRTKFTVRTLALQTHMQTEAWVSFLFAKGLVCWGDEGIRSPHSAAAKRKRQRGRA